jgi:hypothetical protein
MYMLGALIFLLMDNEEGLCDEDSYTIKKDRGKVYAAYCDLDLKVVD